MRTNARIVPLTQPARAAPNRHDRHEFMVNSSVVFDDKRSDHGLLHHR